MTWLLYGIIRENIAIIIPNGLGKSIKILKNYFKIGLLFSFINLGTFIYFYMENKKQPLLQDIQGHDPIKFSNL